MSINRKPPNITKSIIVLFLFIAGRDFSISLLGIFITNVVLAFLILRIILIIMQSYGFMDKSSFSLIVGGSGKKGKKSLLKVVSFKSLYIKTKKIGILSKIPRLAWGTAAAIGFLFIGLVIGFDLGGKNENTVKSENSAEQSKSYINLIDAYENESDLYLKQNDDVRVLLDTNIIQNHPEELNDAIRSYYQKRDEIIFGAGRISELRRRAGLPGREKL